MSSREATSDSDHKAFGPEQWSGIQSRADTFLQEIVVNVTPFSGLTANAIAHLRDSWTEWGDEFVIIRVPAKADCNKWELKGTNTKPRLVKSDESCWYCQTKGTTNGFESLWRGKGHSGARRRTATLHRDIAEPAVDVLDKAFNHWGRNGLYPKPKSVSRAARILLSEDEAEYAYPKLQRTGVCLYHHYGLDVEDIADLTPYVKSSIKNILTATPEVTQEKNNSYTYLQAVAKNDRASTQVIAQELGVANNTVRVTLNRLEDRGRVEAHKDGLQKVWSVIGDWTAPFVCDICGYQSPTMTGISTHERSHNG